MNIDKGEEAAFMSGAAVLFIPFGGPEKSTILAESPGLDMKLHF
jgi:hypothetical protein